MTRIVASSLHQWVGFEIASGSAISDGEAAREFCPRIRGILHCKNGGERQEVHTNRWVQIWFANLLMNRRCA